MAATSIKLPESVKARTDLHARRAGITPHAYMVSAIAAQTELDDQRAAFVKAALAAEKKADQAGDWLELNDLKRRLAKPAQKTGARRLKTPKRSGA
jgi:predicted transcriptional regulator